MSHRTSCTRRSIIVGAVAPMLAAAAQAGITDPGLVFTASNANGAGTLNVPLAGGVPLPGGGWRWVLAGPPLNIMGPNNEVLGTVSQGSVTMTDTGGVVASTFAVTAGAAATNFSVTSAVVSFSAVGNPQLRATAGMTATDNNGNGATVTGNQNSGAMFEAYYNGALPATGVVFSSLVGGPMVEPFAYGSTAANQSFPVAPGVFSTVVGSVSSMSTQWDFTVSAGDQASGTSVFVIIPAPASLALLGAGGLVLGSRRRP